MLASPPPPPPPSLELPSVAIVAAAVFAASFSLMAGAGRKKLYIHLTMYTIAYTTTQQVTQTIISLKSTKIKKNYKKKKERREKKSEKDKKTNSKTSKTKNGHIHIIVTNTNASIIDVIAFRTLL